VQTINRRTSAVTIVDVEAVVDRFEADGRGVLEEQDLSLVEVIVRAVVELQYEGQTHNVPVPFAKGDTWEDLIARFSAEHMEAYGVVLDDIPHKVVNVRCAVIGIRAPLELGSPPAGEDAAEAQVAERPVMFGGEWVATAILRRERLPAGSSFRGPAIVEQEDCTTVIDPGCSVEVDAFGNLVVHIEEVANG
jgi:N-methylhydantoinase A